VYETDGGYIQWVLETHSENPTGVGKELKKFAMWILRQEAENPRGFHIPEATFRSPTTPSTGRATSAPSTPRSSKSGYPRPKAAAPPYMARHTPVPQEENDEELIGAKTEQAPQWDGKPETLEAFMAAAKTHLEKKKAHLLPARPETFDLASNSSQNSGLPSTLGGWNQVGMDTTHKRVHALDQAAIPTGGPRTMK
jgi:hypothetical protein